MAGWICLHRDIQEHWLWNFNEPDKYMAWSDLLLSASHKDNEFMIKGRVVVCKRGQVAMSQLTLQKRWKMSQNKLKRFLNLLKNERMIDYETNELTTIITICNYSKYQTILELCERPVERSNELPVERATDDQSNDKQQCNNVNKDNRDSKESLGEDGEEEIKKPERAKIPYQEIVDAYHEILPSLAQVYKLSPVRKSRIKSLWLDELEDLNHWRNYFKHISRSSFLMGKSIPVNGQRSFIADFDWIINANNFIKISEEKYHGK